jgi:long-chain acyl-CoA synthetase
VPSNVTAAADEYTVAGLIRRFSSSQPDLEMLAEGDRRRTWAEEFAVACRVAQAIRREGVGAGDRVAFLDRNGIAYFDFLFGGALIGAVNVAVNWRLSPAEMAAIIEDSGATLLAIHGEYVVAFDAMPDLSHVKRIVVLGDGPELPDARAVRFEEWIAGCPPGGSRSCRNPR